MSENTNVGLVLEGGGMRGIFTAGVLDRFLDAKIYADYVIGVSAGACQAFSYISRQKGRNFRVNTEFINDDRYLSFRNMFRYGGIFGMDFMFDEIPNKLLPFDYTAFKESGQKLLIGVTNCETGKEEFYTQTDQLDMFKVCRASSSLPLLSKPVEINGTTYFDGGVADPIPLKKSILDGNKKNIVILTQNVSYRKKPSKKTLWLMKRAYPNYIGLCETYAKRHENYNQTLENIDELERNGSVFVIRPTKPVVVGRTEKDLTKLTHFYNEGYYDADIKVKTLLDWLDM